VETGKRKENQTNQHFHFQRMGMQGLRGKENSRLVSSGNRSLSAAIIATKLAVNVRDGTSRNEVWTACATRASLNDDQSQSSRKSETKGNDFEYYRITRI
jgi:hypothetical protein